MNITQEFYAPTQQDFAGLVKPYQVAFAGGPWYEVSKCADQQPSQRCPGGLSRLAIGQACETCEGIPVRPAYEPDELITRFTELKQTRPTAWYREVSGTGEIPLAGIAWRANVRRIADEKYADVPTIASWLAERFGGQEIAWLDEVFADKTVQATGNLANFKDMVTGMMDELDCDVLAYRTVNEAMVQAALRDFGENAIVFRKDVQVPDRRDFIVIQKGVEL